MLTVWKKWIRYYICLPIEWDIKLYAKLSPYEKYYEDSRWRIDSLTFWRAMQRNKTLWHETPLWAGVGGLAKGKHSLSRPSLLNSLGLSDLFGIKIRGTVLGLDISELNCGWLPNHCVLHSNLEPARVKPCDTKKMFNETRYLSTLFYFPIGQYSKNIPTKSFDTLIFFVLPQKHGPPVDNTDPLKHGPVFLFRSLANFWRPVAWMPSQLKVHRAGLLHRVNGCPDCARSSVISITVLNRDQANYQQPKIWLIVFFPKNNKQNVMKLNKNWETTSTTVAESLEISNL